MKISIRRTWLKIKYFIRADACFRSLSYLCFCLSLINKHISMFVSSKNSVGIQIKNKNKILAETTRFLSRSKSNSHCFEKFKLIAHCYAFLLQLFMEQCWDKIAFHTKSVLKFLIFGPTYDLDKNTQNIHLNINNINKIIKRK